MGMGEKEKESIEKFEKFFIAINGTKESTQKFIEDATKTFALCGCRLMKRLLKEGND